MTTTPPTPRRAGHKGNTPCGRRCIMRENRNHVFCTCGDSSCTMCHATARFKYRVPWKEPR